MEFFSVKILGNHLNKYPYVNISTESLGCVNKSVNNLLTRFVNRLSTKTFSRVEIEDIITVRDSVFSAVNRLLTAFVNRLLTVNSVYGLIPMGFWNLVIFDAFLHVLIRSDEM